MFVVGSCSHFHENNRFLLLNNQIDFAKPVADIFRQILVALVFQILKSNPLPPLTERFRLFSTEEMKNPMFQAANKNNRSFPVYNNHSTGLATQIPEPHNSRLRLQATNFQSRFSSLPGTISHQLRRLPLPWPSVLPDGSLYQRGRAGSTALPGGHVHAD